jgi:hypothetical protein
VLFGVTVFLYVYPITATQRPGKKKIDRGNEYTRNNGRTVGHFVFYLVRTYPMIVWDKLFTELVQILHSCEGGLEFLHPVPGGYKYEDLALQVGGVSNETVKYDCEFCGTSTREWLLWQGPEAIVQ